MKVCDNNIKFKTSKAIEYACISRAISFYEKDPFYKSDDFISTLMISDKIVPLLKYKLFRKFYRNIFSPRGINEYVIARTKYFDSIFENAINNNFKQIVNFGAGYDSRAIRFLEKFHSINVFEIDTPSTQKNKIKQLKQQKLYLPDQLNFLSINFNTKRLSEILLNAGVEKDKKTLFIFEGITKYFNKNSIDSIFSVIQQFSGKRSEIVFDHIYTSVLEKENLYYGEAAIYNKMKKSGEKWTFGIEKKDVCDFLAKYGYKIIEQLDANDLEQRYFKNKQGKIVGRVNGVHCLVHAVTKK